MSKMQWWVPLNVARSPKSARRWAVLVLMSLGWLLAMAPAHAEEPQLGAEYRPLVQKVIDAAKARDHQALHRLDRRIGQQGVAALGHHDGIDDGGNAGGFDKSGDGDHDLGVEQHAGLEGLRLEVGRDLRALLDDERRGAGLDAGDAARILRSEARDRGGSENALRGESEQVGLDTGARAAV